MRVGHVAEMPDVRRGLIVLVSHKHRFVFLKTTKTASTSTELFFQPACMPPGTGDLDWNASHKQKQALVSETGIVGARGRQSGKETFYSHMPPKEIIQSLGQATWDDYFRFANVRNPWDKLASHFFFKTEWRRADGSVPETSALVEEIEVFVDGYRRPLVEAFLSPGGPNISDVIRYEQLADDIMRIADIVGFAGGIELPRLKVNSRPGQFRDFRSLFSGVARDRVSNLFADWIETYGYRF